MAFKRYHHGDELGPSEIFKKLMEPLSYATSVEPDIVIVPMLGFDNKLRRIGYGGGFYDRTLAGNRKVVKIGIAFEFMKVDCIPTDLNDIAMDYIVTETSIYKINECAD